MSESNSPILQAIALAGSEAKLGKSIGVSQVAINKAKHRGQVSPKMALAIHRYTGGVVSASTMRPDLWARPEDVPIAPEPISPKAGDR